MSKFTINDIMPLLSKNAKVIGKKENVYFTKISSIDRVDSETLDWINPTRKDKQEIFNNSKAMIIICDNSIEIDDNKINGKCIIIVDNPKLIFLRIANKLFTQFIKPEIHPTSFITEEAQIGDNTYIGPFTFVGKSKIGNNTIIYGNCHIYDNVVIGDNVIIHAGTVIGADGFGYVRNENDEFEKFPHVAGVIIENNVEIGSNTSIDRGSLTDTIIKEGAKIDNLVHIAHNVIIGKHTAVIANSMIGGSTKIGDYSWIAPTASLKEQLKIGNRVVIGVAAVVTKNVPDNETWTGSPARPMNEFIEIQKKIKKL